MWYAGPLPGVVKIISPEADQSSVTQLSSYTGWFKNNRSVA